MMNLIYKSKHGVYLFVFNYKQGRGGARQGCRAGQDDRARAGAGQGRHPPAVFSYRQGRGRAGQGDQGKHPPTRPTGYI